MSNNKQSSVEWLFQNMFEISQTLVTGGDTQYELMKKAYNQAKAKHKEEMIEFAMKFMMQDRPIISFYNETFGGNNE